MAERVSFICYFSWLKSLARLDKAQAFDVLCAIAGFIKDGEVKDFPDPAAEMAYGFMRDQAERDAKKYEDTCKKRAKAGRLGGKAKAENAKQDIADASKCKQEVANLANLADKEKEYDLNMKESKNNTSSADASDAPRPDAKGLDALTAEQPLIGYFYERYKVHTGKNHPSVSMPKLIEIATALNSNEADESFVDTYFGDESHKGLCGDSDCSIFHFASPTVQELLMNRVLK